MKRSWNRLVIATVAVVGLSALFRIAAPLLAQNPATPLTRPTPEQLTLPSLSENASVPFNASVLPDRLDVNQTVEMPLEPEIIRSVKEAQSLDDVRKIKHFQRRFRGAGSEITQLNVLLSGVEKYAEPSSMAPSVSGLSQKIGQLREQLKAKKNAQPPQDSAAEATMLDEALTTYFVVDMKSRITELDKIKARVQEMEAQLERRMKAKSEIIDLQKKVILSEADGLGFFIPENEPAARPMGWDSYGRPAERTQLPLGDALNPNRSSASPR